MITLYTPEQLAEHIVMNARKVVGDCDIITEVITVKKNYLRAAIADAIRKARTGNAAAPPLPVEEEYD